MAKKYIDADKLKARIRKHLIPTVCDRHYDEWEHGRDSGFIQVISIIDSLQQEQMEVDLEEYIENEVKHYGLSLYEASYRTFSASQIDRIIRNAFELGLNAKKEK